jgi:siroheme synthase
VVRARLAELSQVAAGAGIGAPAVVVVGAVVDALPIDPEDQAR